MGSEGLTLQKLEHGRCQCLRHAVDLIDKQDSLPQPRRLNLVINGRHNLAHGIFRHRHPAGVVDLFLDKGKSDGALSGVVGDGIRHQPDLAFLGDLLHDLGLANTWRADEQHWSLPDGRDLISPVPVLQQIRLNGILNFLFCTFNVHNLSHPLCPELI